MKKSEKMIGKIGRQDLLQGQMIGHNMGLADIRKSDDHDVVKYTHTHIGM